MRGETRTYPARGTHERTELVARLADRAKFIRLETVRLVLGKGHAAIGLGVPGVHVVLGPPAALYAHYQLDASGIESAARQLLAGFGRPT